MNKFGHLVMKLMKLMIAAGFLILMRPLVGQPPCQLRVQSRVELAGDRLTLADLLSPESCADLRQVAAGINIGRAPLAGSPRVFLGDDIRWLLERLSHSGSGRETYAVASLPERVVVRRAGSGASGSQPDGSSFRAHPGPLPRSAADEKPAVRPGDKVILLWDERGIRLVVHSVSLDAGRPGEVVRARLACGRLVRAMVSGPGMLRAAL